MPRATKGRAVFYTRDSGGKHEMTPAQYVEWAQRKVAEFGLVFNGTPGKIVDMIATGQSCSGDLFLDYDVAGNELSREGLDQLIKQVGDDLTISHVLIPRRDRLARPDNPLDAMALESSLSHMGVALVFMDRFVPPMSRGQRQDIGEMIASLVDYHTAGKDRTELARKILFAQLALAKAGYSIGGRPPYGFCRWLVREDGTQIRQLEDGERDRTHGRHVVWLPLPDDHPHIITIRRILDMLQTMPASRVAAMLTAEGVPSPDAHRWRTDNGVRHLVSGVWHQPSITNIARNPLLLALCSSGRRSMGDQLRHSPQGPRPLTDADFRQNGKPKVVRNSLESVVVAPARFEPLVDLEQHKALLAELDRRAGMQRGKPRSRDPLRNPLGGRIYDMNCNWPMYRTPRGDAFCYVCAAYMQSQGQNCTHNHVDGPTATRFALSCLRQRLLAPNLMSRLRSKLLELATQPKDDEQDDRVLKIKQVELTELCQDLKTAKRNLALAKSDAQRTAIAEVFEELTARKEMLETEIAAAKTLSVAGPGPAREIDAALCVLDRLPALANDPKNLAAIGDAFRAANVQMFLAFTTEQKKKRVVNKVSHGVITFGTAPLPITPYSGPTGRRGAKTGLNAATVAAPGGDVTLPDHVGTGGEGKSLGNVNRGDGRLAAVLNLDVDTPLAHPKAKYLWSDNNGWSWGDAIMAGHSDVALRLANGDQLLLPIVLRSHPQGMAGELQRIPKGKKEIVVEKQAELVIAGLPRPPKTIDMADNSYSFGFNGQAVLLKSGEYLATIYGRYIGDINYHLIAVSSKDGQRWAYRSTLATPFVIPRGAGGDGPCEAALCRLKSGQLMCIFRISSNLTYGQVWSDDEGKTWTEPGRTDIGDATLSMKDASIRSVQPSLAVLKSGVVVLTGGRPGVSAWIDEQGDGKAWAPINLSAHHNANVPEEPHVFTDGDPTKHSTTGYTEVVALDNGELLVIYDRLRGGWDNLSTDPAQTNSVWVVKMHVQPNR